MADSKTLIEATNLVKAYASEEGLLGIFGGGSKIPALNGVSLAIQEGEFYGLTGESGSGKSSLANVLAGYEKADRGKVVFMGQPLTDRSSVQGRLRYISDEIFSGLNSNDPKNRLDNMLYSVADKFAGNSSGRPGGRTYAKELIRRVGLTEEDLERFPHQISGGQRQRFAIARALVANPKLIICDEPVSNLDLQYRTEMLNLLKSVGKQNGIAFIYISHNPSEVRYFVGEGRVGVMFAGRLMEEVSGRELFNKATHPYTKSLLAANDAPAPVPAAAIDAERAFSRVEFEEADAPQYRTLEAEASDLSERGNQAAASQLIAANKQACPFYNWCPEHFDRCTQVTPQLLTVTRYRTDNGTDESLPADQIEPQHKAACLHYIEQS